MANTNDTKGGIIFRRYRKQNGKIYDAYDYGLKAWPIRIRHNKKKA